MRRLLPGPADDIDLVEAYALPSDVPDGRPFVRCNMISTLDGAVTVDGKSGKLGGPPDRKVFNTLRSLADVILVGAGTVRAEGYGPARMDDEQRRQREARGQQPVPPIAVITRSGNLDRSSPFFTEAEAAPIVLSGSDLDPPRILEQLHEAGFKSVLLEGGPGLNAQVIHAGVLDELCLTLAPRLVGGDGPRVLAGPELPEPLDVHAVHLLEEDGFLFYRLAVRP